MIGLVEGLQRTVRNLRPRQVPTEWGDYYADTNYSDAAMRSKESIVLDMLAAIVPAPVTVLDLGANTGRFSRRIRDAHDCTVIAADIDELAVERNYDALKSQGETGIIPVILDLTNPPGGAGWANEERPAFFDRAPHDTVVALALIHHLAISNNLTLEQLAAFFGRICRHLVIEFVPKSDSQVQRLLVSREDIFPDYDTEHFELEFAKRFVIQQRRNVADSQRSLYLMSTRNLA
jgi:ribosomal protein L11 methylase PrmA